MGVGELLCHGGPQAEASSFFVVILERKLNVRWHSLHSQVQKNYTSV